MKQPQPLGSSESLTLTGSQNLAYGQRILISTALFFCKCLSTVHVLLLVSGQFPVGAEL